MKNTINSDDEIYTYDDHKSIFEFAYQKHIDNPYLTLEQNLTNSNALPEILPQSKHNEFLAHKPQIITFLNTKIDNKEFYRSDVIAYLRTTYDLNDRQIADFFHRSGIGQKVKIHGLFGSTENRSEIIKFINDKIKEAHWSKPDVENYLKQNHYLDDNQVRCFIHDSKLGRYISEPKVLLFGNKERQQEVIDFLTDKIERGIFNRTDVYSYLRKEYDLKNNQIKNFLLRTELTKIAPRKYLFKNNDERRALIKFLNDKIENCDWNRSNVYKYLEEEYKFDKLHIKSFIASSKLSNKLDNRLLFEDKKGKKATLQFIEEQLIAGKFGRAEVYKYFKDTHQLKHEQISLLLRREHLHNKIHTWDIFENIDQRNEAIKFLSATLDMQDHGVADLYLHDKGFNKRQISDFKLYVLYKGSYDQRLIKNECQPGYYNP